MINEKNHVSVDRIEIILSSYMQNVGINKFKRKRSTGNLLREGYKARFTCNLPIHVVLNIKGFPLTI